jgi:hypothetical protein
MIMSRLLTTPAASSTHDATRDAAHCSRSVLDKHTTTRQDEMDDPHLAISILSRLAYS